MQNVADLTHLQRTALAEAYRSASHSLVRQGARFIALHDRESKSGIRQQPAFTLRLVRMLERDWIVEFDDPAFPSRATLTKKGLRLARELDTAAKAKAGAA